MHARSFAQQHSLKRYYRNVDPSHSRLPLTGMQSDPPIRVSRRELICASMGVIAILVFCIEMFTNMSIVGLRNVLLWRSSIRTVPSVPSPVHPCPQPAYDPYKDPSVIAAIQASDLRWRLHMSSMVGFEDGLFLRYFSPSFHCDFEERLGLLTDGGKWLCRPRTHVRNGSAIDGKGCLIYSFGSNQETSFEQSILQLNNCGTHLRY